MTTPLYQQVERALRSQILMGQRAVGTQLPTEHELSRMFGVSRDTIRQAVRALKSDGLVRARRGSGTHVVRSRPSVRHATLRPLTAHLEEAGLSRDVELLEADVREPTQAVRDHLRLAPGERILYARRTHKIAAQPFSILTYHVPESIGLGPDEDLTVLLYEVIEEKMRCFIAYGTDQISARMPTTEEAGVLSMRPDQPLLIVRRIAYTDHDRPVQFLEAAIRSDLYEYGVTLPRAL